MTTPAPPAAAAAGALPSLPRGVTTSEFWVTAATTVIALLTALHVIAPGYGAAHQAQVAQFAWVAATAVPGAYALARAIAKHGHQQAVAAVLTATINAGRTVAEAERLLAPVTQTGRAKKSGDTGEGAIGVLVAAIGIILGVVGAVWLIVGATHHRFDVAGLVLLVIGVALIFLADRRRL